MFPKYSSKCHSQPRWKANVKGKIQKVIISKVNTLVEFWACKAYQSIMYDYLIRFMFLESCKWFTCQCLDML